jgi:hypothetical protein
MQVKLLLTLNLIGLLLRSGLSQTTTRAPSNTSASTTHSSLLALLRLENIKNSINQRSRLTKLNATDFVFDFVNATTGVAQSTGGRTVSASVSSIHSQFGPGVELSHVRHRMSLSMYIPNKQLRMLK